MSTIKTTGLLYSVLVPDFAKQKGSDGFMTPIKVAFLKVWNTYVRWQIDRSDSQKVSKLSDHLLADIGITRHEAIEIDARREK